MAYASLADDPVGTAHHKAACCWCSRLLVIAEAAGGLRCWVCPACWGRQEAHALYVEKKGQRKCLYMPLPSQVLFEENPAKNVLWGGQAGPGKSHGARWWLYKRSLTVPGHQALLLRENWGELETHHLREMAKEQDLFGAKLVDKTLRFPNGSFIDCGHMADVEAVSRYLSTEYGAIVPDEASRYPVESDGTTPLSELSTRARKVYRDVNGRAVRPRFMPVSNPGGPSAAWLRDMFVDGTPDFEKYPKLRPVFNEAGEQIKGYRRDQWAYIPARLDDNPYQDPEYEETLAVLNKARYEQLRHGDWHVFSGMFFSEWAPSLHVAEATIAS
jgi:phage terminase large subunit